MNPLNQKALVFAMKAHEGQFRKDGKTPYIVHPIDVAERLSSWGLGRLADTLMSAAYLHDTLEDTDTQLWQLAAEFGDEIACLVDDVTFSGGSKSDKQAWLDGLAIGTSYARLLKAADILCNTEDFINDGNPEYAIKYLHYADKLMTSTRYMFNGIFDRDIERIEMRVQRPIMETYSIKHKEPIVFYSLEMHGDKVGWPKKI